MSRLLPLALMLSTVFFLSSGTAFPADKTVNLKVEKMTCFTCPFTVKKALNRVAGVKAVKVSFLKKRAVVTFDDTQTSLQALTKATTHAGYPSRLMD